MKPRIMLTLVGVFALAIGAICRIALADSAPDYICKQARVCLAAAGDCGNYTYPNCDNGTCGIPCPSTLALICKKSPDDRCALSGAVCNVVVQVQGCRPVLGECRCTDPPVGTAYCPTVYTCILER